ncbi:hypothetical protein Patl1_29606 [Pistacia atlantica]|uniref:Uncharacterized protein n=1 Tax=Pistacia atlantica TaxID=434234 RepID=A0ACC1A7Y7_9ROSI|nr:hypothetical protein Patl1_29606 [Pistacia atlantica]
MAEGANRHRRHSEFQEGDMVYLKLHRIGNLQCEVKVIPSWPEGFMVPSMFYEKRGRSSGRGVIAATFCLSRTTTGITVGSGGTPDSTASR